MTDEAALRAAIFSQPGEDTPRLVYADFLGETDRHEQAAFIPIQISLGSLGGDRERGVGKHYASRSKSFWLAPWRTGLARSES